MPLKSVDICDVCGQFVNTDEGLICLVKMRHGGMIVTCAAWAPYKEAAS